jgi:HPt (histidine-containing phosphotransfer) domain-containing protein
MEPSSKAEMTAALALLWQRFLPEMLARVSILEEAARACAEGTLIEIQIEAAHSAAHKLAGSLGSFNITRGSVLARELELLYSGGDGPDPQLGPQVTSLAAELRALVEAHK